MKAPLPHHPSTGKVLFLGGEGSSVLCATQKNWPKRKPSKAGPQAMPQLQKEEEGEEEGEAKPVF